MLYLRLPNDAWEKKLALPWIRRLFLALPPEVIEQADEDERAMISQVQQEFVQRPPVADESRNARCDALLAGALDAA